MGYAKFRYVKKDISDGCGLFTLYGHEDIRKNSSSLKPLFRF